MSQAIEQSRQSSNSRASGALVVGAGGAIGSAVLARNIQSGRYAHVSAVSRNPAPGWFSSATGSTHSWLTADNTAESIAGVIDKLAAAQTDLQSVVICNGILHADDLQPEKSLEMLSGESMQRVFHANAVVPMLWLQALLSLLRASSDCTVAILSARVGSIADNRLGGWYSYRASKAALNMLVKTASIEFARRAPRVKLLAFHPGTTDSALSAPFQKSVPAEKLFSPAFVAQSLESQMDEHPREGNLAFVDWNGKDVPW